MALTVNYACAGLGVAGEVPDERVVAESPGLQPEAAQQRLEQPEPASHANAATVSAAESTEEQERSQKVPPQELAASAQGASVLASTQQELTAMGSQGISAQQVMPAASQEGQKERPDSAL